MSPGFPWSERELTKKLTNATASVWATRSQQKLDGKAVNIGNRGEVTGGQHLNGYLDLFEELATHETRAAARI